MSSAKKRTEVFNRIAPQSPPDDLLQIIRWFEDHEEARHRFRWTLRDSIDELLDGQRTGRWCYQHLTKTEKTYLGTAIEVNLTREFEITDGSDLDWNIDGVEVDCKFSKDLGGWEIPMEMYLCGDHGPRSGKLNHPALLVWVNDDASEWAAGLLRITDERLRWKTTASADRIRAYNRDNKRRINEEAFSEIYWLWGGIQADLPTNLLLHLDADTRDKILTPKSSGQGRLNELFRHITMRLVNRQVVLAVGQQDDAPKRVRDSRIALRDDGFIIVGHQRPYTQIAHALDLTLPAKGSWMSVRVTPVEHSDERAKFGAHGRWWAIARSTDTGAAPVLSETTAITSG
ncbi:restriction endonuclease [Rhodococcus erythropolis]|nr:restriction endonuclease [Rhodococcus sp. 008]OKA13054.1 restriction endonuclease [Rhodococcus erythropolis]